MHGEGYGVALTKRNYLWPRLHARTLFGKYEFSAGKIPRRLRQKNGHLYGENVLAVKVLVQTIVITLAVLQEQGRWPRLTGIVASLNEFRVRLGIADIDTHRDVPTIRNRGEPRIDSVAKLCDDFGQRIVEILVLASSKAMP
jgi:hypothetical protein